jgi:hypothetical protein
MVFLFFLFFAIETSCPIGAGDDAIFASDTSSEILHDDSIFTTIGRLDRTYRHTGSLVTVHTGHGDELRIDLRIFPMGHSDHLVPIDLSPQSLLFR